jgi:hypothetical protein
MRIPAAVTALSAAMTLAGGSAAWAAPPAPSQPLVITADHVRQAHGVTTWKGHVTVSGRVDPARTALTLDGKRSAIVDLATAPPLASARLTDQAHAGKRARLDLVSRR